MQLKLKKGVCEMAKGVKNEKKHRFVVGYQAGSNNTVWGQLAFLNNSKG